MTISGTSYPSSSATICPVERVTLHLARHRDSNAARPRLRAYPIDMINTRLLPPRIQQNDCVERSSHVRAVQLDPLFLYHQRQNLHGNHQSICTGVHVVSRTRSLLQQCQQLRTCTPCSLCLPEPSVAHVPM